MVEVPKPAFLFYPAYIHEGLINLLFSGGEAVGICRLVDFSREGFEQISIAVEKTIELHRGDWR
jgi:hypothetical protein